ncbi:putative addiction module antidote protein [Phenylobacterium sp. LjRoot219]|uniref:addiction module antidote protein n=1 Tax=Phenylobacterium sp. LjRoot219 TaxID=3342283 RepID=UPI003ECF994B
MPLKTRRFDAAEVLDTPEAIEAFLEDAFESEDAGYITHALGVVARARGMTLLAQETGITRQALYKALSSDGHPEFGTVLKVAQALGFRLTPERIPEHA